MPGLQEISPNIFAADSTCSCARFCEQATNTLQLFRIFEQLDHAFEQAAGASTVDTAMVEA